MKKIAVIVACVLLSAVVEAQAGPVLIRTPKPYANLVAAIEQRGGTVTHQFKYIDAIAAEIPDSVLDAVRALVPPGAVFKDLIVNAPQVASDRKNGGRLLVAADSESAAPLTSSEIAFATAANPDAYLINNTYMNLGPAFAQGYAGQGMKVAVIDSGIRPNFPHISLDGSVIGGEDFVGDGRGFSNSTNEGHGTFVAGMISANVVFTFASTSTLLRSVRAHCPTCLVTPTGNQIPMVGSAPASSIYALRVFGTTGGAPTSRILAAMERVIELRENFDNGLAEISTNGKYSALNIKVCNMSLGGSTLFAGHDLEDEMTHAFLAHDIVLVTSAGNAGPSGTTGGSPGTGFDTLTVGATSSPIHERVLRDIQLGLGFGVRYRPFGAIETAYFSSRGPTADGRVDPDLVANGFASFGQGFGATAGSISIASGTSFSSPSVAGVAAVVRQAAPGATARQVRNALIASANPALVGDGSGPTDQGKGYVNAAAAISLLQGGQVPDTFGAVGGDNTNVNVNIRQGAGIATLNGNVTRTATGLLPGQRYEIYYDVHPNTSAVIVTLSNVVPGAVQNALFGDDILLAVHSAKTSSIGEGDYKVFEFTTGKTFMITRPETGLMRVTLNGDWTNASPIDATVKVFSVTDPIPRFTQQGKVLDGNVVLVPFNVSAGALELNARLGWREDWASYPTNDIDLILIDPLGHVNVAGATLNNPETTTIANPFSGQWLAIVDGFEVNSGQDKYELRIAVDGAVLK